MSDSDAMVMVPVKIVGNILRINERERSMAGRIFNGDFLSDAEVAFLTAALAPSTMRDVRELAIRALAEYLPNQYNRTDATWSYKRNATYIIEALEAAGLTITAADTATRVPDREKDNGSNPPAKFARREPAMRVCPQCHGDGICSSPDAGWLTTSYHCPKCHGTGKVRTALTEPTQKDQQ